MKVAMLGWELPPFNSGGLGVACFQLCRALARDGVQIDFILPYKADYQIDFMSVRHALPITVSELQPGWNAYSSARANPLNHRLAEADIFTHQLHYRTEVESQMLASEQQYDVIHAHDWLSLPAGLSAQAITGRPLIAHIHSVESDRAGLEFGGNPYVREIERLGLQRADAIIAVSEHTKRVIMREYQIPADKIQVIHNSIDHAELHAETPDPTETSYRYLELMKQQGWKVVMNIGRLTIQKGLDHLLAAAGLVVKQAPKTLFVFVGDGELRDELLMKAAEQGLTAHVLFTGFQRGKRWRDAYEVADLFVMPSISEPFGLTPLEAIAHQTPVLISLQSGVAEVLKNALKVDFWDTNKMAEYITAVVQSSALQDELTNNASRELQNLSWRKQSPKFIRLYRQAADQQMATARLELAA